MHAHLHGAAATVDTVRDVNYIALNATIKTILPSDADLLGSRSKSDLSTFLFLFFC
jgi:hypothetical protein